MLIYIDKLEWDWIWCVTQLYANNLFTVITRLNPVDRAEFEPRFWSQKADSIALD